VNDRYVPVAEPHAKGSRDNKCCDSGVEAPRWLSRAKRRLRSVTQRSTATPAGMDRRPNRGSCSCASPEDDIDGASAQTQGYAPAFAEAEPTLVQPCPFPTMTDPDPPPAETDDERTLPRGIAGPPVQAYRHEPSHWVSDPGSRELARPFALQATAQYARDGWMLSPPRAGAAVRIYERNPSGTWVVPRHGLRRPLQRSIKIGLGITALLLLVAVGILVAYA